MRFLIVFSLLFFSSFLFAQIDTVDENRIYWNKNFTLVWEDFKGDPTQSKETSAALSNIALPYGFETYSDGKVIISIYTCFLKNTSWVKDRFKNKVLLQHEQLHFDIAELFRRKIVKELSETDLNIKNTEVVLKSIMNKIWGGEYKKMQELYDAETNFSRIIRGQIEWNNKIALELEKLEQYNYTVINVGGDEVDTE